MFDQLQANTFISKNMTTDNSKGEKMSNLLF